MTRATDVIRTALLTGPGGPCAESARADDWCARDLGGHVCLWDALACGGGAGGWGLRGRGRGGGLPGKWLGTVNHRLGFARPPAVSARVHGRDSVCAVVWWWSPVPGSRRERGGGGGGDLGPKKGVYRKWGDQIVPTVNLAFSHDGPCGLGGGVPGGAPPIVVSRSDTSVSGSRRRCSAMAMGSERCSASMACTLSLVCWSVVRGRVPRRLRGHCDVMVVVCMWGRGREGGRCVRSIGITWRVQPVPCASGEPVQQGCIGRGGGNPPAPSLRPVTVPLTASAWLNGICNRQ